MNNLVKFINTKYLKDNTSIEQNVDDKKLVPYIYKTQDTHLQEALGTTFYEHLKQAFISNLLTTDEYNLIDDYIQPMVSEWTFYEVYPSLNFKSTNKGISTESSEWSQSSQLGDIKYMRNDIRNMAEFYTKRLIVYLTDNRNLFDSYNNPDCPENLSASTDAYFSGIHLKRNNNC